MLCVTAFCHKDWQRAVALFEWILELEGSKLSHPCLLVAAKGMDKDQAKAVFRAASGVFESVNAIEPSTVNEAGWPVSANHLFRAASSYVAKEIKKPFWFNEPDCIPIKNGWLDALENEYAKCGQVFMGNIFRRPFPHLTGCAVYPADIAKYNPAIVRPGNGKIGQELAWDCVATAQTLRHTYHTPIYQHVWGNFTHNTAPTFPTRQTLAIIKPETMIFHRVKDGSLQARLREYPIRPAIPNP